MTIRALVVDDSKIFQRVLSKMLTSADDIEVVGVASDPYEARDLIVQENPDVITLDINLPRMSGLDFLKRLMQYKPLPVIIISSLTSHGSQEALDALALGAAEVLPKPTAQESFEESSQAFCQAVRAAAAARVGRQQHSTEKIVRRHLEPSTHYKRNSLICIGASTGGTEAIKEVMQRLPDEIPPIVIAQHMPPVFTKSFAERLDALTPFTVVEAAGNELVQPNHVYIAPGDYHLRVNSKNGQLYTSLDQGERVHYQRPAVDILFESVAKAHSGPCSAAILTGMGSDGAAGMLQLKQKGALCCAQNEATCVVYGMPRVAVEMQACDEVLALEEIADYLITGVTSQSSIRRSI